MNEITIYRDKSAVKKVVTEDESTSYNGTCEIAYVDRTNFDVHIFDRMDYDINSIMREIGA